MKSYIDLSQIYDDTKFGDFSIKIETNKILTSNVIKNFYNVTNEYEIFSDVYLFKNDELIMTSTEFELLTNKPFLDVSFGDILIFGLGLGMIIYPLLEDSSINSITVIEKEQELINYIGDKIKTKDINNKVSFVLGDVYGYHEVMSKDKKYDVIFFDYWHKLTMTNVDELENIKNNYRIFLKNDTSVIMSWCEDIKQLLIDSMNP